MNDRITDMKKLKRKASDNTNYTKLREVINSFFEDYMLMSERNWKSIKLEMDKASQKKGEKQK